MDIPEQTKRIELQLRGPNADRDLGDIKQIVTARSVVNIKISFVV